MTRWQVTLMFAVLLVTTPGYPQTPEHRISAPMSFFDDADVMPPGTVNLSSDFSYGSVDAGHDLAFPGGTITVGLNRRMHLTGSTGYVRSVFEEVGVNGIGDTYVGLKFVVFMEGKRRPALAVKPSLEVLGDPSVVGNPLAPGRANFLIPVTVQKSFDTWRVYYTTGYLTRGIVFHSLAWEWNGWSRLTPVVVLSHGRLTRDQDFIAQLGLNRSRSDILAGVGIGLGRNWGAYWNFSRSFGRSDPNSLRYQISAGLGYTFRFWGKP